VTEPRRRRANGEASRQRILDAAAEIAGERGYEGTSITLVSERSGLPASSIYWHFADKDDLLAAVIDRSFGHWRERLAASAADAPTDDGDEHFRHRLRATGRALAEFPDFLRLGLMLILDRRPDEPTARARFIAARTATAAGVGRGYATAFPDLDAEARASLVTLTMALADGLFIAGEVEHVDVDSAFELMATAILATAERLRDASVRIETATPN
jgi:AcrR family transcriptional regulator